VLKDIRAIFLDYDGVLNDMASSIPKWAPLVAEFFPSRLGGAPDAWARANRDNIGEVYARTLQRLSTRLEANVDMQHELEQYKLDWLTSMCDSVGVSAGVSQGELLELALEAQAWMIPRVASPYTGVATAVGQLANQYLLFTASAGLSGDLQAALTAMDIGKHFRRLYGSDLVQAPKLGPAYYRRVFDDADIPPGSALVVDDNPNCLGWAREVGAQVLLVRDHTSAEMDDIPCIASLPELLEISL
jgi:HAD superfamily hydrolase (TIGR01509 family)